MLYNAHMEKTSIEQRNENIATELFEITDEQIQEMILAKQKADRE